MSGSTKGRACSPKSSTADFNIAVDRMPRETDVVKRAAEFCSSAKFERVFDSFARCVQPFLGVCLPLLLKR